MSDVPVQIIIAAFNTPGGAGKALNALKEAKKENYIAIEDAAVVVKGADGKLKITDSKRRGTKGMITGGVIGGLIGVLAGPVGWLVVGGGVIGALSGKMAGSPMKNELKDLGTSLVPNSSAIVAVIDHKWVADLEREMAAQGAKVVHDSIKQDIAEQLNAGGNVLYTAAAGEGGAMIGRVAETKDKTEVGGVVATDDGVYVEHATLTDEKPGDGAAAPAEQTPKPTAASGTPGTPAETK
jgi:uncharacterized membrane protein